MCGIMGILSDGRPEETRAAVRDMMADPTPRSRCPRERRDSSGDGQFGAGAHAAFHRRP